MSVSGRCECRCTTTTLSLLFTTQTEHLHNQLGPGVLLGALELNVARDGDSVVDDLRE